jgi:methylated-DNA-[protein]-cysteine S-methyltransferase
MHSDQQLEVVSFATNLGWMALVGSGPTIQQVLFGYPTQAAVLRAIRDDLDWTEADRAWPALVRKLKEYAAGKRVDFSDVQVDLDHLTPFQRRVIKHCRAIGYGQTRSYGELAKASGSARAARAVGNTMAGNRYPLIVPCHRVINSDGSIGQYSALEGPRTKVRLLKLEKSEVASLRRPLQTAKSRRVALSQS